MSITISQAFSSFSIDDMAAAKNFYGETLGFSVHEEGSMGLQVELPGGGQVFLYPKQDHSPATFTVLNFVVTDIERQVTTLKNAGVQFEQYAEGMIKTDEHDIARGGGQGPDIAWFKDPAGNILSVLEAKK